MILNIKLFVAAAILTAALGAAWYINWAQKEIQVLRDDVVTLSNSVKLNEKAIQSIQADVIKSGLIIGNLNIQFQAARKENNNLRERLSKHDIGFLAANKPGLVERIVNNGTQDVGRCFEIVSGAPLTKDEKAATKKSQVNSSCSDIANPAFKDEIR